MQAAAELGSWAACCLAGLIGSAARRRYRCHRESRVCPHVHPPRQWMRCSEHKHRMESAGCSPLCAAAWTRCCSPARRCSPAALQCTSSWGSQWTASQESLDVFAGEDALPLCRQLLEVRFFATNCSHLDCVRWCSAAASWNCVCRRRSAAAVAPAAGGALLCCTFCCKTVGCAGQNSSIVDILLARQPCRRRCASASAPSSCCCRHGAMASMQTAQSVPLLPSHTMQGAGCRFRPFQLHLSC